MIKNRYHTKESKRIGDAEFIYSLNEEKKTASVIKCKITSGEITIPTSIIHKSNEYVITSISTSAFQFSKIKSLKFSPDSKLLTIENLAFSESEIESITIPPHLTQIKGVAFFQCKQLRNIEIHPNSDLQIIGNDAFSGTSIENFTIPLHLTKICECAFCNCQKLRHIEIPSNSELQTIEMGAFDGSSIESISIPSSLVDLKDGWGGNALKLSKISVSPDNPRYSSYGDKIIIGKSSIESEIYDVLVFCAKNIKTIEIPSFIRIIGPYAFERCFKLRTIEIQKNSELRIIENYAFFGSSIERIELPPLLERICKYAFSYCSKLRTVDISENSQLQIIDEHAFFQSSIKSFVFPIRIKHIGDYAFSYCEQLQMIEIDANSEIKDFDQKIFDCSYQIISMNPTNLNIRFNIVNTTEVPCERDNSTSKIFSNIQVFTKKSHCSIF